MLVASWGVCAARAPHPGPVPPWYSLNLRAPEAKIAEAAGLPAPSAPEYLLADLIRVLHERPIDPDGVAVGPLGAVLREMESHPEPGISAEGNNGATLVPLPLAPSTWRNAILAQPPPPAAPLAPAILRDRRAALLYTGLLALDVPTLLALERDPAMLAALQRHASVFAAFGASLVIREGVVVTPGQPQARSAWETLVGASVAEPGRFVPALYGRDDGRLAYFYDALAHLDEPHRRYALGGWAEPGGTVADAVALYEVFKRISPEWDAEQYPFYRPLTDPAVILAALRVTEKGRLAPPSSRRLWTRVFGDRVAAAATADASASGDHASAAWLLDRILDAGPTAAVRLAQVRFAQRVFAVPTPDDEDALAEAIAAVARFPALAHALERLGAGEPRDYVRGAQRAAALPSHGHGRDANRARLALFQGMLAMIVRATSVRSLEPATARRLAGTLVDLDVASDDPEGRLLDWLSSGLLPALASATGMASSEPAERVVLRALSGARPPGTTDGPGLIEWEGLRYRIDLAAGEIDRLEQLRARQGPPTLDQALALHRSVSALAGGEAGGAGWEAVSREVVELETALAQAENAETLRQALVQARRRIDRARSADRGEGLSRAAIRDLLRARALVGADVITALAYLPYLGDPRGQSRLGGHVARRHSFGSGSASSPDGEPAWSQPRERVTPGEGWHVQGALVGLDAALARLALRRIDVDRIPLDPRLDEATRAVFIVDAALADPRDRGDAQRDQIVAALSAGRARAAALTARHEDLDAVAAALRLEGRRLNLLRWGLLSGSIDPSTRFSLAELVRLGARQPLPCVLVTVPDGSCPRTAPACPRPLTDLGIRLIEGLSELRLPTVLLPGLLTAATQDLLDEARMLHPGDWPALWRFARELPLERIEDYVSGLAGNGPLVVDTAATPSGARR